MIITAVKTRILHPPKDNLLKVISGSIEALPEESILVVTSKVVSIWQGRCIPASRIIDKDVLVMMEAEYYLPRDFVSGKWVMHTIKDNLLIPTAGIDESNAAGHFILWPTNPKAVARKLHQWVRKTYRVKNIGILITDSHSIPLRRGVVGISLAHYGFESLKDYRRSPDIFGKALKVSQANVPDSLAAAAVFAMGEGNEQTPLALITKVKGVKFGTRRKPSKDAFSEFSVPIKEDLYGPFITSAPWKRGGMAGKKSVPVLVRKHRHARKK